MGNLFKIFGAFTNGSVHIQADGEDADTVKWVFETASDGKSKAKKNRVKEEAGSDEEEGSGDDDEMQDEGEKKKTSNKQSVWKYRSVLSRCALEVRRSSKGAPKFQRK